MFHKSFSGPSTGKYEPEITPYLDTLREKCPNTELFLIRIFLYLDWIQENTDQK